MSQLSDWREQAAYFGMREAKGERALATKMAERKYMSLTGRELSLGEIQDLTSLVEAIIEKTKTEYFQQKAEEYRNARQK